MRQSASCINEGCLYHIINNSLIITLTLLINFLQQTDFRTIKHMLYIKVFH